MADQELLKFARARDHQDFSWRVAAALTVKAQAMAGATEGASVEAVAMRDWVLDNPMQAIDMMAAFAATHPPIAEKVSLLAGAVDTAQVLDADILYIVDAKWETVAAHRFAG